MRTDVRINPSRRITSAGMAAKQAARNPHEHGRTGVTVMTIADKAAHELSGTTALVTGASLGFGRGIAAALSKAGARVAGVARDRGPLEELRAQLGGSFTAVPADAADPVVWTMGVA